MKRSRSHYSAECRFALERFRVVDPISLAILREKFESSPFFSVLTQGLEDGLKTRRPTRASIEPEQVYWAVEWYFDARNSRRISEARRVIEEGALALLSHRWPGPPGTWMTVLRGVISRGLYSHFALQTRQNESNPGTLRGTSDRWRRDPYREFRLSVQEGIAGLELVLNYIQGLRAGGPVSEAALAKSLGKLRRFPLIAQPGLVRVVLMAGIPPTRRAATADRLRAAECLAILDQAGSVAEFLESLLSSPDCRQKSLK